MLTVEKPEHVHECDGPERQEICEETCGCVELEMPEVEKSSNMKIHTTPQKYFHSNSVAHNTADLLPTLLLSRFMMREIMTAKSSFHSQTVLPYTANNEVLNAVSKSAETNSRVVEKNSKEGVNISESTIMNSNTLDTVSQCVVSDNTSSQCSDNLSQELHAQDNNNIHKHSGNNILLCDNTIRTTVNENHPSVFVHTPLVFSHQDSSFSLPSYDNMHERIPLSESKLHHSSFHSPLLPHHKVSLKCSGQECISMPVSKNGNVSDNEHQLDSLSSTEEYVCTPL